MNKNGHKEEKFYTKKENAKDDFPCILFFCMNGSLGLLTVILPAVLCFRLFWPRYSGISNRSLIEL